MGYDSTFSGAMTPSKKIPDWIVDRIRKNPDLSLTVQQPGDEDCDGDVGDIIPVSREMHGYNLGEDLLVIQRALAKEGIRLNGEIERVGQDGGDFEKFTASRGKIYRCGGEVVYRGRREISVCEITRFVVRIVKERPGRKDLFYGWLGQRMFAHGDKQKWLRAGPVSIGKAPFFCSRSDAEEAANANARPGTRFEIISVEREI